MIAMQIFLMVLFMYLLSGFPVPGLISIVFRVLPGRFPTVPRTGASPGLELEVDKCSHFIGPSVDPKEHDEGAKPQAPQKLEPEIL